MVTPDVKNGNTKIRRIGYTNSSYIEFTSDAGACLFLFLYSIKMHIVIATDKFKHSLTSFEVCKAISKGLLNALPGVSIQELPLADGGDGLAEVMAHYLALEKKQVRVLDPLFREIETFFLCSQDGQTCFLEMAKASGLALLQPSEYNCALTTSYGTGQLLKEAVNTGATKIILGIGGSATNDCGIGIASAFGYKFLDKDGNELKPIGKNLGLVHAIDSSRSIRFQKVSIQVACDVSNYLTGDHGATRIYAPQKGATPDQIAQLEDGMIHFAHLVKKELGMDLQAIQGGGAAGGIGAGCVAFLGAELVSGTDLIFTYSKAEEAIKTADIVITGEGKIDEQTLQGKLVHGISSLCHKHNKPLIAFCGVLELSTAQLKEAGITAAFSIVNRPMSVTEAKENAAHLLSETSYSVAALLK